MNQNVKVYFLGQSLERVWNSLHRKHEAHKWDSTMSYTQVQVIYHTQYIRFQKVAIHVGLNCVQALTHESLDKLGTRRIHINQICWMHLPKNAVIY